jgi:hypothetical protein
MILSCTVVMTNEHTPNFLITHLFQTSSMAPIRYNTAVFKHRAMTSVHGQDRKSRYMPIETMRQ